MPKTASDGRPGLAAFFRLVLSFGGFPFPSFFLRSRWYRKLLACPLRIDKFSVMFSMLLAPNTPEWLLITVVIVYLIFLFGLGGWGLILEIRYISPYTLIQTSNRDKWRKALILAFLQTAMIPVLGLAAPVANPLPDQWLFIPICTGVWIVVLPIAALYKRWEFERHIKNYQRLDKMIKDKNGVYQRLFATPVMSWTRIFMTADQKRFFSEGFPNDMNQEKKAES